MNKLSPGARGEKDTSDPETVLTDLTGEVALGKGVSMFSDISFGVPGPSASQSFQSNETPSWLVLFEFVVRPL